MFVNHDVIKELSKLECVVRRTRVRSAIVKFPG